MRKTVLLWLTLTAFGLTSCINSKIKNEDTLRKHYDSAVIYNYLGKEEEAINHLNILQTKIRKELCQGLIAEDLIELSTLDSKAWLERGRIYREQENFEGALKCFNYSITSYVGYDHGKPFLLSDPIVFAFGEFIKIYEQMGNKEEAEKYKKNLEKILNNSNQF